jgi:hypothetical protein
MDEFSRCTVTCPACAGPVLEPSPSTGISRTRQVGSSHPVWTRYPGPQPLGAAGPLVWFKELHKCAGSLSEISESVSEQELIKEILVHV